VRPCGDERTPPVVRRSERPKLEAASPAEMGWEGGSSLDNDGTPRHCQTGWVRQARRKGVRKEPASERPSRRSTSSNLADVGWAAARTHDLVAWGTPEPVDVAGREASGKACGVPEARLLGHSWAPTPSNGLVVNMGTNLSLPPPEGHPLPAGTVHRPPLAMGWGGGPVVVRGRESRPHGEGVQRVRSIHATPGGRW
jgi:hypothetical protein